MSDTPYGNQTAGSLGEGAIQVLLQGNNNSIIINERTKIPFRTPMDRNREFDRLSEEQDLDVLRPEARSTTFVGRDEIFDEYVRWANAETPFSIRQITGKAGAGKTRFAVELLHALDVNKKDGWIGGFITSKTIQQFETPDALSVKAWPRPALFIIDYAAYVNGMQLKELLLALYRTSEESTNPVRIILLDRGNVNQQSPWPEELTQSQGSDYSGMGKALDCSQELPPIELPNIREHIFIDTYNSLATKYQKAALAVLPPSLQKQLIPTEETVEKWSEPLTIMMTALVAVQSESDLGLILSLTKQDLAIELAKREKRKILEGLQEDDVEREAFRKLIAGAATLSRGLTNEALEKIKPLVKESSEIKKALIPKELEKIKRFLPVLHIDKEHASCIGFIQPDIIAEALLYLLLEDFENEDVVSLLSLLVESDATVMLMLGLTIQDFARVWDTEKKRFEEKWITKLFAWYEGMIVNVQEGDIFVLLGIADNLPTDCLVFRDHSCTIYEKLLEQLRALFGDSKNEIHLSILGTVLNNLANLYSDVGRLDDSIPVAEEAVNIYSSLSVNRPEVFLPDYATSLNNLANLYSDVGRLDESIPVAEEAVDIRRALSANRPELFLPDYATSLNNLATLYSDVGRLADSIPVAEEAVNIRRALSSRRPELFLPDYATSLNNSATLYRDVGRIADSIPVAEEAVDILRVLSSKRPEVFLPDYAKSLSNLANLYSDVGRLADSIPVAEEAVDIRRALSVTRPEVFLPNYAMSLSNLANRYRDVGRLDKSIPIAEEARDILRKLWDAYPLRYSADYARNLGAIHKTYKEAELHEKAHNAVQEAVTILNPHFIEHPMAHFRLLRSLVHDYIAVSELVEIAPNEKLLMPIALFFKQLEEGKEDSEQTEEENI